MPGKEAVGFVAAKVTDQSPVCCSCFLRPIFERGKRIQIELLPKTTAAAQCLRMKYDCRTFALLKAQPEIPSLQSQPMRPILRQ
jgi:hypothetical protein